MAFISSKQLKPVLKFDKFEYKYLSPFIYKSNDNYSLLYCNRKDQSKFYGEINLASSKNLFDWKKNKKFILKPNLRKNYLSYISPNLFKFSNYYLLFIEAQKKNQSDIICYQSKKLNDWKIYKNFKISKKNHHFQSPFIYKIKNKFFLYYSHNRKKIKCLILDEKLNILNRFTCITGNSHDENFSIYSPSIIKLNSMYYMFYAAWKNINMGNIKIAFSKNGINWEKKHKEIFTLENGVKIISEPFVLKFKKNLYIFFEYKKNSLWNISYKKLKLTNILF